MPEMEEGEWEAKYWDLVGRIALEEAEEERRGQKALPHFYTMLDDEEKEMLVKKYRDRCRDGLWIGNTNTGNRPSFVLETKKTRELTKKRRLEKARSTNDDRVKAMIIVAHVAMWDAGKIATGRKRFASHICHDGHCINPDHLEWESADHNMLREVCNREKICQCGLQPSCDFTLHPERHALGRRRNDKRKPSKTSKERTRDGKVKLK